MQRDSSLKIANDLNSNPFNINHFWLTIDLCVYLHEVYPFQVSIKAAGAHMAEEAK
jgi:hypothetical protein